MQGTKMIKKRTEALKVIKRILRDAEDEQDFPKEVEFCPGIGQPIYKIIITKEMNDTYVDGNGQTWKRVED